MAPRQNKQERRFIVLTSIAVSLIVWSMFEISGASFAAVMRDPKALGNDLFDAAEFSRSRRERAANPPRLQSSSGLSSESSSEASSVSSSESSSEFSSSVSSSSLPPLIFEDLSSTERETLRLQLRIGGCPTEGDARYIALCREMLSKQQQPVLQEGLKNPNQQ